MVLLYIGIAYIILSFLSKKRYNPFWGFLVILLIMGFQTFDETDYIRYEEYFIAVKSYLAGKRSTIDGGIVGEHFEIGWQYLNYLFSITIFPVFVFFISLFQYWVLARFVKKYIPKDYQFLAGIMFFFTAFCMLYQMNALRQGLAIELALLSMMMLDEKKVGASIFFELLAISMHVSALLYIPILIIFYFQLNKREHQVIKGNHLCVKNHVKKRSDVKSLLWPIIVTSTYLFLYLIKPLFIDQLIAYSNMMDLTTRGFTYLEELEVYDLSILFVIYDGIMVFLLIWYYQVADKYHKLLSVCGVIGCFCEMLFFGLGSFIRIFMFFFLIQNMVMAPILASFLARRFGKPVSAVFIICCILYAFKTFYPQVLPGEYFGSYRFVFLQ